MSMSMSTNNGVGTDIGKSSSPTQLLVAKGLGKSYRRRWALTDCNLEIPAGHVVGLVGPNGAGKTTLLQMAVGLRKPTTGTIEVLGAKPSDTPGQLERVSFVAQDTPTYPSLSVEKHLRMGRLMNPNWDRGFAEDPSIRSGSTSSRRPDRSRVANVHNLHSRSLLRNVRSYYSWTNRSRASTRSHGGISSRFSWSSSPPRK